MGEQPAPNACYGCNCCDDEECDRPHEKCNPSICNGDGSTAAERHAKAAPDGGRLAERLRGGGAGGQTMTDDEAWSNDFSPELLAKSYSGSETRPRGQAEDEAVARERARCLELLETYEPRRDVPSDWSYQGALERIAKAIRDGKPAE